MKYFTWPLPTDIESTQGAIFRIKSYERSLTESYVLVWRKRSPSGIRLVLPEVSGKASFGDRKPARRSREYE